MLETPPRRLPFMLVGNALLRIGGGASTVLAGLYLVDLNARGLPATVALAGTLGAASFGVELVAATPMGWLADVFAPRRLMVVGALLGAVAVQLFGLSTDVAALFLCKMLEGLAAAAVVPALLARVTDLTETHPAWRARAMSYFELSLLSGVAFGGLVGGLLWGWLGATAFAAAAAIYMMAAALLFAGVPGGRGHGASSAFLGLVRSLREPSLRRLAPIWLLVNAVIGLWLAPPVSFLLTRPTEGPQFLAGVFADRPDQLGLALFGYAVVFGLGVAGWSRVLHRVPLRRVLQITLTAMLAACAGLLAFNHSGGVGTGVRWVLGVVTAACIMVESGFTPAALVLLADVAGGSAGRGATMGIYSGLLGVGAVAGSLLAGWLGARMAVDGLIVGTVVLVSVALALTPTLERRVTA